MKHIREGMWLFNYIIQLLSYGEVALWLERWNRNWKYRISNPCVCCYEASGNFIHTTLPQFIQIYK